MKQIANDLSSFEIFLFFYRIVLKEFHIMMQVEILNFTCRNVFVW